MYGDVEKFWCGYITDFNEKFIQIQHFSKSGQPDGLILEKIANIESIDTEDDYSLAFQYLIENQDKLIEIKPEKFELPNSENWQYDFLEKYKMTNQIISMEFEDDFTIYGKINELDLEIVKIETIGDLGDLDGFGNYKINDIKTIRLENIESIKRRLLSEWRKKKSASG
jgi:hypothetical protein